MTTPSPKDLLARALVELRTLRQRLAEAQDPRREPIAVIGVGCRFPGGCDSPAALWRFLCAGGDATGDLPPGRWTESDAPDPADTYTRRGAYLAAVDGFDARFFGVTERELQSLDPQHRLVLEVCWEALEHAAIAPDRLRRSRTGVFCGISNSDYAHLLGAHVPIAQVDGYYGPGTALSFAPGRVAYFLGLQGPSLAVDTACSSSLVAVHLACQSLRARECDHALGVGVNLILSPAGHVMLCRARVLSPEGRCKTFDAGADGYARGEGCGVVVLRRLADALADGDPILAVIRGSAVNQDGPASGLTVPNPLAQESVIRDALAAAALEPAAVDYVEAHGTATSLGDPIEARALAAALGPGRPPDRPLLLGTIKTNLGHLESAAGIAGIIKLVLAIHHGELLRHLHLRRLTPAVAWDTLPLAVVQTHRPWPPGPRIAGVSSFGASGTNAHAILGALTPELIAAATPANPTAATPASLAAPATIASPVAASATNTSPELLLLSAASDPALRALAARHAERLADPSLKISLADWCATAARGRARLAHALTAVARTPEELATRLAAYAAAAPGDPLPPQLRGARRPARPPRVAFVFSGQGAHEPGMGRSLRAALPAFRAALDAVDVVLRPALGRSVLDLLDDPAALDDTLAAQPALFAFGWALAAQWRAWGVEPVAVFGHSLGEYLAACLAGVLRLEDAAPLVVRRAALMHALPRGHMVAVSRGEADVAAAIARHPGALAIAAINGPAETVLSGSPEALAPVLADLTERGARTRRLRVSHAFHSPLMDPALDAFEREVAALPLSAPQRPLISDLTGRLAADEIIKPAYWRRHMREPVRFADGLAALRALGCDVLLEVGPGRSLSALAAGAEPTLHALPSLRGGRDEHAALLDALGELALRGAPIHWPAVHTGDPRRRDLPTYPFQRRRHWFPLPARAPTTPDLPDSTPTPRDPRSDGDIPTPHDPLHARTDTLATDAAATLAEAAPHDPLLGRRLADDDTTAVFESELHAADLPILRDHRVYGVIVVSGTVHATMALRAAAVLLGAELRVDLDALEFLAPLVLPERGGVRVRTRITPAGDAHRFELVLGGDRPLVISRGLLRPAPRDPPPPAVDLPAARARCPEELAGADFYARFWPDDEHSLGPAFRTIDRIWRRDGEALARLRRPAIDLDDHRGLGREALLGACIGEVYGQVLMPAVPDFVAALGGLRHTFLGHGIARSRVHADPSAATHVRAVVHRFTADELSGDIQLLDDAGRVLVTVEDLRARRVPRSLLQHAVTRAAAPAPAHPAPPRDPGSVRDHLRARVAALVGGPADFTDDVTLQSLGVDSLMAIDLHDGLRRDLGVALPLDATLQGESLADLTHRLLDALGLASASSPPTDDLAARPSTATDDLAPPSPPTTSPHDPTPPTNSSHDPTPPATSPHDLTPPATSPRGSTPPSTLATALLDPAPSATPATKPLAPPAPTAPAPHAPPWLRTLAAPARPTLRLLCFPHGGGAPAAFLPWRGHLPAGLAVDVVQLPGRWERLHEPPHTRLEPLLAAMLAELAPRLEPPFACFGVSMGALVAHAFTRALVDAGGPAPTHLIVAAYPAPDLPNPLLARRDLIAAVRGDDPGRLARALAGLGLVPEGLLEPAAVRLLLPALRADLELVSSHEHRPGPPLAVPIAALGGADDPDITRDQLAAWSRHTTADFTLRILPGPHLFYRTSPQATLRAIAQILAPP